MFVKSCYTYIFCRIINKIYCPNYEININKSIVGEYEYIKNIKSIYLYNCRTKTINIQYIMHPAAAARRGFLPDV